MKIFKHLLFLTLLVTGSGITSAAARMNGVKLSSPDSHIIVNATIVSNRLTYTVVADGSTVIANSPLGITVDSLDLGMNVMFASSPTYKKIDEKYQIFGNHSTAHNLANEAVVALTSKGHKYHLILRAYNDGVAVRYSLPDGAKRIDGESTSWRLPLTAKTVAWMDLNQCYEGFSHVTSFESVPNDKIVMGPLTINEGTHLLSISEADCEDFSDMAFVCHDRTFKACFPFAKNGWEIKRLADENPSSLKGMYGNLHVTPWRTVIIAKNLTDLVNSDLIMNLCPAPSAGSDYSWVKPGRCLWHWWSIGAPIYENQKAWYDAAAKLKWEYYLIDEGWSNWKSEGKDPWTLLKKVIDYGKSVGVKSMVWVNSSEMRNASARRAYLEKVKALGAAGIKIDFIPDATSQILQWYMGAMQDCAELKLLLNFHGSVKPTGLSRTYPNNITREAVRGDEYHMSRYGRVMPYDQDVSLPFTRLMAGAADVTPVMLDPQQLQSAKYSWPHEFAQAIVYLSPITHFCDQYKFYIESPMFDLFQTIPTTWDETRVLSCTEMGKVVAYARRKGDMWWIGVMNGAEARTINLSLDFLKTKKTATLVYDNNSSNTAIDRREKTVSPDDKLEIKMLPGGGFVGRIK
ncbi:glycoside hydrolase family 97 protein [Xylanibacter oryzae]|uniref:glycoside hydrolase family 97 protein n=1 Tax=Xylanibacter oryzae TaxID=185293 RepID=UPI0012B57C9F|nr:glycoside hydrolase family 97 protein [Xylanibacter oryzae]